ncbi:putative aquaporin 2 [Gymnopilus junonius]|uniref:Aquaporin 2 n=1 Tax=Gymnopilus junonius TaxID=109634 RepID=A0A9P5TS57_GYMJU|nr:putative aquaporin 2 [Gymnopilus junonius]
MGVFFYVFYGLGSQVAWAFQNNTGQAGLASIFQIGFGYCFGIIFALVVCAGTSGGHFNPGVTLTMVVLKGFPKGKALRYIVAQILGGYIACLVVYAQWKDFLDLAEGVLLEKGLYDATMFTPNGVAGAFANYKLAQQSMGRAFMNEFFNCFMIGLIIWSALDPTNVFVPPALAPILMAFSYAAAIWGYSVPSISLNTARDLGGRLAALTIWGMKASGGGFSAISALVNIPATLIAAVFYEIFFTDSDRVIDAAHLDYIRVHANHARLGQESQQVQNTSNGSTGSVEKGASLMYEHAPNDVVGKSRV